MLRRAIYITESKVVNKQKSDLYLAAKPQLYSLYLVNGIRSCRKKIKNSSFYS